MTPFPRELSHPMGDRVASVGNVQDLTFLLVGLPLKLAAFRGVMISTEHRSHRSAVTDGDAERAPKVLALRCADDAKKDNSGTDASLRAKVKRAISLREVSHAPRGEMPLMWRLCATHPHLPAYAQCGQTKNRTVEE